MLPGDMTLLRYAGQQHYVRRFTDYFCRYDTAMFGLRPLRYDTTAYGAMLSLPPPRRLLLAIR